MGGQLLGQDIQCIARHPHGLQLPGQHAPRDHRALQQIPAELREDPAAADLAHPVTGPPDPLQTPGHRAGGLNQEHLVHRAHVDAHLQRAGGDDGLQLPALEEFLDLGALRVADAPVVGADQLGHVRGRCVGRAVGIDGLGGSQLVQPLAQALAEPSAVHKADGGPVGANGLKQGRIDGGPHALLGRRSGDLSGIECAQDGAAARVQLGSGPRGLRGALHVRDRDADLNIQPRRGLGIDDRHLPVPAQEARCLLQGPHRRG